MTEAEDSSYASVPQLRRNLNASVADRLREAADLLAAQAAEPFRAAAYRRAADTIASLDSDIGELVASGGYDAIDAIPGIGPAIAAAVMQLVRTGRWTYLDQLRGQSDPEVVFRTLPGVGPMLARQLHLTLGAETLADLEAAVHSGRIDSVSGLGPRRIALLRAAVTDALSRIRPRTKRLAAEPPVGLLLDVDREYERQARTDLLPKIAPKRFNPSGEAWLPVLHTHRDGWSVTALYSNSARAHELHREHDWVVIYFHSDHEPEGQRTVVTETRGALAGRRVIRGREDECLLAYARDPPKRAATSSAADLDNGPEGGAH
ncbi:DNA-binding protein [Alsobacter sp. R-9]